jgi:RES domain-containing protein
VRDDDEISDTQFVGAPEELVRATDARYIDGARSDFAAYIAATLAGSMRAGGRFNPPGEFGAVYCADGHATMWAEVAARFGREGVPGLPPRMGVLRIQVRAGRYADLTESEVCALWQSDFAAIKTARPTTAESAQCHAVGRAVRGVADFLVAPSARATGLNYAVFPDRSDGELVWQLMAAAVEEPPIELRQHTAEAW